MQKMRAPEASNEAVRLSFYSYLLVGLSLNLYSLQYIWVMKERQRFFYYSCFEFQRNELRIKP